MKPVEAAAHKFGPNSVDAADFDNELVASKRSEILAALLGDAVSRKGSFAAFASAMGKTAADDALLETSIPSYTVVHSLEWISRHVRLGSEMPFMEDKIDRLTGRLIVDNSNADEIKQRAPDWTRQAALAAYLAQPQRKFGPIMAVISPEWVEDSTHTNWSEDNRARVTAAEFTPLEPGGVVGLLKLDRVRVYALDGQHRILGMRGLRELRDQGFLQLRSKDGAPKATRLTQEDFFQTLGLTVEDLQSVFTETIPVEYIPAVVRGETHSEATRRIRRTFIALNSYAKKTEKGENILLDETDGYAILARRLALDHPLFKGPGTTARRVNWKTASIPGGRVPFLTTLSTIQEMAQIYLTGSSPSLVQHWVPPISGMVPMRPADADIDLAYERLAEMFDRIHQLPTFRRLEELRFDDNLDVLEKWRDFPKYSRTGKVIGASGANKGNLLLRPIGQTILVGAVAKLLREKELGGAGLSLNVVFKRLGKLDAESGFEARRTKSVWYGVTYAPNTNRIINRNRAWADDLLVHLVGGTAPSDSKKELWWNWVTARATDLQRLTWRNLSGKLARFDWEVSELPPPIAR